MKITKKKVGFVLRKIRSIISLFIILLLFLLIISIVSFFFYYKIHYESYVNSVVESMSVDDFQLEGNQEYKYSDGSTMLLYSPYQVGKLESSDQITDVIRNTLVASEDERFYEHNGIDLRSITRAFINNLKGGSTQGASTITQQLVKLTYLSSEKSYDRKIKEAFIAIELEKRMEKDDIMLLYLNKVYFANGIYGIYDASEFYFSKSYEDLTYDEAASLIAIINSPTKLDPIKHEDENKKRRDRTLNKLNLDCSIKTNFNINESYGNAYRYDKESTGAITYIKYLVENDETLLNQSVIETTIDKDIQHQVETIVDSLNDPLESAICVIDNSTGKVIAIDGAKTTEESSLFSLNRAFQSPRQTGSSIKPLLDYTPIFDRYDVDPEFYVYDTGGKNIPKNSNGRHLGKITIKKAVTNSVNTIAFRLYSFMKHEDNFEPLTYLEKMNFSHLDERDYNADAVSIGGFTWGATVLEMASGYATLENRGIYRIPTAIESVDNGSTVVYSPLATSYMTECMLDVVKYGTAKKLKPSVPVAAKTGTTNDGKDAWLCGFTRDYTIAIWVGADNNKENYKVKSSGEVLEMFRQVLDILPNSGEDIYTKEEIEEIESHAYTRQGDGLLFLYFKELNPGAFSSAPVATPQEPQIPVITTVDENGNIINQEVLPGQ